MQSKVKLSVHIIATGNSYDRIIEPLLSRFVVLKIPGYTFDEFSEIAVTRLRKENIEDSTARFIVEKVWNELGSRDIRDIIKVARLANTPHEVSSVTNIIKNLKY